MPLPFARLCLVLALVLSPAAVAGQAAVSDPDVTEGIRLVENGDYDAAILTLDNAARRLAADPARVRELSQAYLYLGIAYVGKGHEAAARAKFREALAGVKDLSLSPEKFPPKVIDLFEAAREETSQAPARATAVPTATKPAAKKGGSKAPLILLGVGGAAAGVALAAGGGGGSSAGPSPVQNAPAPPPVRTEVFAGRLVEGEGNPRFEIRVEAAAGLEANLTWDGQGGTRPAVLVMELFNQAGQVVARSNPTGERTCALRADVAPQVYSLSVFMGEPCGGCSATFELRVTHP